MQKQVVIWMAVFTMAATSVSAQRNAQDTTYRRWFIGSTLFVLGNFFPNDPNPPGFVQLNVGYRITPRDVVALEAKTWKYAWPLGIPYSNSFEAPEEKYPGYIRDVGIAFVYQRFWWKGAYTAVHAMNARQRYVDVNGRTMQQGYQLFMTYRVGYHIPLFKNRFFIEPGLALTHWPVRTNVPESFARLDSKWPNHFFPEPGLHVGVKF